MAKSRYSRGKSYLFGGPPRPRPMQRIAPKPTKTSEEIRPYALGLQAAAENKTEGACPFDRNSSAGEAWLAGFRGE